jgi:Flp pilus assembly protein TadB
MGQESQALQFFQWSQVLTQDVSIAHDIQAQETEERHALAKKSSTRARAVSHCIARMLDEIPELSSSKLNKCGLNAVLVQLRLIDCSLGANSSSDSLLSTSDE